MSRRIPVSCFSSETTGECAVCDFGISSTKNARNLTAENVANDKTTDLQQRFIMFSDIGICRSCVQCYLSPPQRDPQTVQAFYRGKVRLSSPAASQQFFSKLIWWSNFTPQIVDFARAKLQLLALEACGSKQN